LSLSWAPFQLSSLSPWLLVLCVLSPLRYLNMLRLEESARLILTDSGGAQKEACWLGMPCVTLCDETEWVETVEQGWNVLAGVSTERIITCVCEFRPSKHSQFGPSFRASAADGIAPLIIRGRKDEKPK
jgi:UDP-GlcNAc3NAcA epimerase